MLMGKPIGVAPDVRPVVEMVDGRHACTIKQEELTISGWGTAGRAFRRSMAAVVANRENQSGRRGFSNGASAGGPVIAQGLVDCVGQKDVPENGNGDEGHNERHVDQVEKRPHGDEHENLPLVWLVPDRASRSRNDGRISADRPLRCVGHHKKADFEGFRK